MVLAGGLLAAEVPLVAGGGGGGGGGGPGGPAEGIEAGAGGGGGGKLLVSGGGGGGIAVNAGLAGVAVEGRTTAGAGWRDGVTIDTTGTIGGGGGEF